MLERVCVVFPTSNIGGRKLWGISGRNCEKVCVDFQKAILAEGNYGGFLEEIVRRCAWISKKQHRLEETIGEFF